LLAGHTADIPYLISAFQRPKLTFVSVVNIPGLYSFNAPEDPLQEKAAAAGLQLCSLTFEEK